MAEFAAYSKELTPMLETLQMDDEEKEKWQSEVASRVRVGKDLRDRAGGGLRPDPSPRGRVRQRARLGLAACQ